jgi:hypothetical protein
LKGTLQFNLPEEWEEFVVAQNGAKWKAVVTGLTQFLRSQTKYRECPEAEARVYEEVRTELFRLVADDGLEL